MVRPTARSLRGAERSMLMLGACVLAVGMSVPAAAQESRSGGADSSSEEIVVTAQFREQSVLDTPLAITAISGNMLEARSLENIREIDSFVPNVSLQFARLDGGLIAYIRGVGQNVGGGNVEPGVGMYIDDVYVASSQGALFNLVDLDRVEVLRGPQGTLAGKNSEGGAIKLFSKKPTGDGSGYVQATYGADNLLEGRAAVDFALAENLAVRVNVAGRDGGGYVDRLDYACVYPGSGLPQTTNESGCKLGTMGGQTYVAGRVALRWTPSDALEVNLSADYTADSSEPAASVMEVVDEPVWTALTALPGVAINGHGGDSTYGAGGRYVSYATYCNLNAAGGAYCAEPRSSSTTYGFHGAIDIAISENVSLTSITAYRNFDSRVAADNDGSPFGLEQFTGGSTGDQISQELRLNASFLDDKINATVGGFYIKYDYINNAHKDGFGPLGNNFDNDQAHSNSKAVYAQVTVHPTERLHLTGGIRYTKEFKDYQFFRVSGDGTQTPDPVLYDTNFDPYSGSRVDYRANIAYDLSDDLMVYAQYATGFKGGGVSATVFSASQVVSFNPETVESWEGGIKGSLFDRKLTFAAAGFYSDYTNLQVGASVCPWAIPQIPCGSTINAGGAHIKGLELEVETRPVDGLSINGGVGYLDFQYYYLSPIGSSAIGLNDVAPFTPEWSASLGMQYEADLGGPGTLTPRLDMTYRTHVFGDVANNTYIPGNTLLNGGVTWQNNDRDLSIALRVTNISNKYYYDRLGTTVQGVRLYDVGAPRQWSLSVRKEF